MIIAKWRSFMRHVCNKHKEHPDSLFKVPINPKIFFCFEKSLNRSEQNGAKIFVFG